MRRCQFDPQEKEMATHSGILAWETPRTEELGGWATVHGVIKESDVSEGLNNHNKAIKNYCKGNHSTVKWHHYGLSTCKT